MARYIDAEAAIDAARRSPVGRLMIKKHNLDGWLLGLPAADVAPVRHGRWEPYVERLRWRCSECGSFIDINPIDEIIGEYSPNFCPHCGAKMDGGDGNV